MFLGRNSRSSHPHAVSPGQSASERASLRVSRRPRAGCPVTSHLDLCGRPGTRPAGVSEAPTRPDGPTQAYQWAATKQYRSCVARPERCLSEDAGFRKVHSMGVEVTGKRGTTGFVRAVVVGSSISKVATEPLIDSSLESTRTKHRYANPNREKRAILLFNHVVRIWRRSLDSVFMNRGTERQS